MSTMYYTYPERVQVGQTHYKGKGSGMHFTWCMFPMEFANYVWGKSQDTKRFVNEYGEFFSFAMMKNILMDAASQSFDERIE